MDGTKVTIKVRKNGSLRVDGPVELIDHEGNPIEPPNEEHFALCRCGHSANKPFCDGSHKRVGFEDERWGRSEEA